MPTPGLRGRLALLGILAFGLTVRLWTIGNGIPHTVGVDEPEIMNRVVDIMKSGDYNPHFFDYGGLTIYFHTAVASVRFAVGALIGEPGFGTLGEAWAGNFYLWARTATALIGALLVYVVYRIGLRWGLRTALIAALFTAIHPSLVREAHFALTDTPLTLFVALTMLVALIAAEDGRLRWFALAGMAAGLATAVKYNGAVALLMPLAVAALSKTVHLRAAAAIVACLGWTGAFIAGAPYSVLDLPEFLKAFAHLAQSYNQSRPPLDGADVYLTHVRNSFSFGWGGWSVRLGWPALLLGSYGFLMLLIRRPSRAGFAGPIAIGVFSGAYLWLISHQSLIYMRYALPLLPVLCLGIGMGISTLADRVSARIPEGRLRFAVLLLLVLPMVPPSWQAFRFNWDRAGTVGTEELAARWLEKNVSPKDPILAETPVIRLPPQFNRDYTHSLIRESLQAYQDKGVKYLVLSSEKTESARQNPGSYEAVAYQKLLEATQVIHVITRTDVNPGPTLTILKVPPK